MSRTFEHKRLSGYGKNSPKGRSGFLWRRREASLEGGPVELHGTVVAREGPAISVEDIARFGNPPNPS